MNEFFEIFSRDFMPHGHCFYWKPEILWLHVASDVIIAFSYFTIPIGLKYFVTKRKDLAFKWMFTLFGAFIFACGTTHLFDAWTMWNPDYGVEGIIKLTTAIVSASTAIALWMIIPKALTIPTPSELEVRNQTLKKLIQEKEETEKALKRSETLFRKMFVKSSLGMTLVDIDFKFLQVNPNFCQMLDYTENELREKTFLEITYEEDKTKDLELREKLFEDEIQNYQIEKRYITKNNKIIWVNLNASILRDDDGKPFYYLATVEDITRKKKMESELKDSQQKMEGILRLANDAIISINNEQKIILFNEGAEKIFGYESSEILGKPLNLLLPNRFESSHPKYVNDFGKSKETSKIMAERNEIFGLRKGGEEFYAEASISKFELQEEKVFTAILRDITEKKVFEKQLKEANISLESKVQERTKELSEANEELKRFVYIVSHDLRAPLINIKGFSSELKFSLKELQNNPKSDSLKIKRIKEDIEESINFIESSTLSMSHLIDLILKLSRLGKKELVIEEVNLNVLLNNILDSIEFQIEQTDTVIEYDSLPLIRTDLVFVEQIFSNLISNSIKYRNPKVQNKIQIFSKEENNSYLISVSDNGLGIAKENISNIFEPFSRFITEIAGEGMGLAYVKTILKKLGGEIECQSEINQGAIFTIKLPKN